MLLVPPLDLKTVVEADCFISSFKSLATVSFIISTGWFLLLVKLPANVGASTTLIVGEEVPGLVILMFVPGVNAVISPNDTQAVSFYCFNSKSVVL